MVGGAVVGVAVVGGGVAGAGAAGAGTIPGAGGPTGCVGPAAGGATAGAGTGVGAIVAGAGNPGVGDVGDGEPGGAPAAGADRAAAPRVATVAVTGLAVAGLVAGSVGTAGGDGGAPAGGADDATAIDPTVDGAVASGPEAIALGVTAGFAAETGAFQARETTTPNIVEELRNAHIHRPTLAGRRLARRGGNGRRRPGDGRRAAASTCTRSFRSAWDMQRALGETPGILQLSAFPARNFSDARNGRPRGHAGAGYPIVLVSRYSAKPSMPCSRPLPLNL